MTDMALIANNINNIYEGTDLATNSKSIIKAINELYVNQQILFATSANLFKKINLSLGDLPADDTLKEAYVQLKFTNVFDGLVKLDKALKDGIDNYTLETDIKIREIKEIIGNLENDTELQEIFTTMGWSTVVNAIVDVNNKLDNYINNSSGNYTTISTTLRESLAELKTIVGTVDTANRDREAFRRTNFTNILAAIVELNNIIGYNTADKEEFNQSDFESMLQMVITTYNEQVDLSASVEETTYDLEILNDRLKYYSNNLSNIETTVNTITRDYETLKEQLGDDIDFIKIQQSLVFLEENNRIISGLVGSLTDDAEAQNTFNSAGYTSIVDGMCKLTTISNNMVNILGDVENDTELKTAWNTSNGYDNVISAILEINKDLGNLATNNVLKAAFLRLGFSNLAEGLEQFSLSIATNTTSIENIQNELNSHKTDKNAHSDIIPAFLVYQSNKEYTQGERVYVKEFPTYLVLECETGGKTSDSTNRPDFAARLSEFNS